MQQLKDKMKKSSKSNWSTIETKENNTTASFQVELKPQKDNEFDGGKMTRKKIQKHPNY